MPTDTHYQTAVAVPDLLGFLPEDQRAVLAAMSGMDQDAPRQLEEVASLLGQAADAIFFQASLAIRALYRELLTVDPNALRLVTSTLTEHVAADVSDPGILSLHRLIPAVRAGAYPAQMLFVVVNLWTGGRAGETHQAGTRIMTPDGEMLAYATTPITAPGLGAQYAQVLDFRGQVWPEPGLYSLEIWLDGAPLSAYILPVYEDRRQETANEPA